jgi:hypothetical protein
LNGKARNKDEPEVRRPALRYYIAYLPWTVRRAAGTVDNSGNPLIDTYRSGDFFLSFARMPPDSKRRTTMQLNEQSFSKATIFLIKEWDGFQRAMRSSNGNSGGVQ